MLGGEDNLKTGALPEQKSCLQTLKMFWCLLSIKSELLKKSTPSPLLLVEFKSPPAMTAAVELISVSTKPPY